jgi:hypothetical protein
MRRFCSGWRGQLVGLSALAMVYGAGCGVQDSDDDEELEVGSVRQEVIVGPTDDRIEYYQSASEVVRRVGDATMGVATALDFQDDALQSRCSGGTCQYDSKIYTQEWVGTAPLLDLYPGSLFMGQRGLPWATAFLVGPDTILTAGHAICGPGNFCSSRNGTMASCGDARFVVGFKAVQGSGTPPQPPNALSENDIYTCVGTPVGVYDGGVNDWAIVKLNRVVVGATPIIVQRTESLPASAQEVAVVGYPRALPLKVAGNGVVVAGSSEWGLNASVDAFVCNSGGPLIDTLTGVAYGISDWGAGADFVKVTENGKDWAKANTAPSGSNPGFQRTSYVASHTTLVEFPQHPALVAAVNTFY